jgi:hypothetical protein
VTNTPRVQPTATESPEPLPTATIPLLATEEATVAPSNLCIEPISEPAMTFDFGAVSRLEGAWSDVEVQQDLRVATQTGCLALSRLGDEWAFAFYFEGEWHLIPESRAIVGGDERFVGAILHAIRNSDYELEYRYSVMFYTPGRNFGSLKVLTFSAGEDGGSFIQEGQLEIGLAPNSIGLEEIFFEPLNGTEDLTTACIYVRRNENPDRETCFWKYNSMDDVWEFLQAPPA